MATVFIDYYCYNRATVHNSGGSEMPCQSWQSLNTPNILQQLCCSFCQVSSDQSNMKKNWSTQRNLVRSELFVFCLMCAQNFVDFGYFGFVGSLRQSATEKNTVQSLFDVNAKQIHLISWKWKYFYCVATFYNQLLSHT